MAHEITLPVIDAQGRRGSRGWLVIILRWAAVLTGNLVDRFLDVVAQAGLVLLGVLLVPELDLVPDEWEDRLEIGFLAFAAAVILLLIVMYRLRKRIFAGRSMRFRRRLARL